jgi:prepilin-type N-terminal cleavage/methylation domain-containing protein
MERRAAFTLVELMVVVAIVGILAATALPNYSSRQGAAYNATVESDARLAATAQEAYFASALTYSSACTTLPGYLPSDGVVFAQCSGNTSGFLVETDHPSATKTCIFESTTSPSLSCADK